MFRTAIIPLLAAALGTACVSCAKVPGPSAIAQLAAAAPDVATAPAASTPAVTPPAIIAVDVGHSKEHPGAISARGVTEFEFNSALAKGIAQTLADERQKILLIGGDGDMNHLENRTAQATGAGAGFFLSIHHDSVKPRYLKPWVWQGAAHQYADEFSGFGLFVSRKNPHLTQSLQCASAIGLKLREAGFRHSTYHADPVMGESREWADEPNGVYYYDDLVVLKTARQPAVLLEAGVILNRDEEAGLASREVQEHIARAVRAGLQACGVVGARVGR